MGAWDASRRRIAAITESATLAVDAKAKALKAAGEDVIGFGAGEPDFPTPEHIVEAAVGRLPRPAQPPLLADAGPARAARRDRAQDQARLRLRRATPSQVLVTNGGKHAVYNTFQVLLDPGDEVLVPAPYWTTYPEAITLGGGVPVVLPATARSTASASRSSSSRPRCTPRTKALLFVSPSNPTGAVYPPDEVEAIGRWARRARDLGDHRRDLRAPHLRRARVLVDAGARARARRPLRRPQRRRQDLRDDRVGASAG